MKYILFTILLLFGCNDVSTNEDLFNYKNNLNELIDSYIFLSETHDLLHIMMGEYEGSPINSYNDYKNQIDPLKNNVYLKPIYSTGIIGKSSRRGTCINPTVYHNTTSSFLIERFNLYQDGKPSPPTL